MKMTREEVLDFFRPLLMPVFIRIADQEYTAPRESEVWSMVKDNYIEQYRYTIETLDCDDYALLLHAWVRQEQYRHKWPRPWAFGEAWGVFGGNEHALNVVITSDQGLMLIEPQSDGMKKHEKKDILLFVRI